MAILNGINFKNRVRKKINDLRKKTPNFLTKRKLALLPLIIALLAAIPLHRAQAQIDIVGAISTILQTVLFATPYFILWIFTWIATVFVYIATYLVDAALTPGIYLAVINSAGVDKGWTIMRDTANLFFILILIFIALATTLRLQSYSAKTWIPKLLFGALFINYSKVITLFIIDIGNMFMYGVISWMGGGGLSNTGIGALHKVVVDMAWNLPILNLLATGVTITQIIQVFAAFMFALFLALTLFAFGALLQIRVAMLTILTIFSPIAFMLHAWPNAGKYAGQWWSALLKYIVFGPIIVFFLYIAGEMAVTVFSMGSLAPAPTTAVGDVNLGSFGGPAGIFANIIPFVIIIVMLLAGLNFTSEMGIVASGLITGTVKGLGTAIGGAALWKTAKLSGRTMSGGYRGAKGAYKSFQEGRRTGGLAGGLRNLGSATKNAAAGMDKRIWETAKQETYGRAKDTIGLYRNQKDRKDIDHEKKKLSDLNKSSDDMRKELRSLTLDPTKIAARLEKMAEKGDLKEEDRKHLTSATALGTNLDKKIIAEAMPHWYAELKGIKDPATAQKTTNDHVAELIDKGKIRNINPEAWNHIYKNVEQQLDPKEFDRIIDNSSKKTKEKIQQAIENMISTEHTAFRANPLEGHDQFNYNIADTKGFANFNRKSRLALLKGEGVRGIFKDNTGIPDSGAIQNFSSYNYKDLDKFNKQDDLELIANTINENTLARIRSQDLSPAKARTIGNWILAHRTGSNEAAYVNSNAMWKP